MKVLSKQEMEDEVNFLRERFLTNESKNVATHAAAVKTVRLKNT